MKTKVVCWFAAGVMLAGGAVAGNGDDVSLSLKDRRILASLKGTPSEAGNPRDILVNNPDYVVFVPRNPHRNRKDKLTAEELRMRGDTYNDHFQVISDPARGLLYAFWTQATWEGCTDQHIAFSKSADKGLTWTYPVVLAGSECRAYPKLRASWQQPMLAKSGRLYCLWNQQTTSRPPHYGQMFGLYSDDGGETWSEPKQVPFPVRMDQDDPDPLVPPCWCNWQRPLRLGEKGKYFVGCSRHGKAPYDEKGCCKIEFWQFENIDEDPKVEDIRFSQFATNRASLAADKVAPIPGVKYFVPTLHPWGHPEDPAVEEASIVRLPDGRLFAMMRSSIGCPVWSQSRDGGRTWSGPKALLDSHGKPFPHPRSPCPLYDWKGPESGSGYYFGLVHMTFDMAQKTAYQQRGPLYLIAGRFDPQGDQPIRFSDPKLFAPRKGGNSFYSSYTVMDGEGVLWFNDKKYYLLGRRIGPEWFAGSDVPPYGVCAHVTRSERDAHRLKGTVASMQLAGMKYVRSDFDAWAMRRKDGTWDFSGYDKLLDELEAGGLTLLPILYAQENPPKDMKAYADYVRTVVRHFGRRLPVIEIWNEANLNGFFRGADPEAYARTLRTAYAAVKEAEPSVRVAYTGTAGVPLDWIRRTFAAGATNCFDVMNVHPYTHPNRPEGGMDRQVEKLRALMAEFGVGDKPIWFTEIGWPTHSQTVSFSHILQAGLKVARPEQKRWRVVVADVAVDGPSPDQEMANRVLDVLPPGSEATVCTQRETIRRLSAGEADAVVYPFDETFPSETIGAVNEFIRKGGTFVDFGGLPCYFGKRGGEMVKGQQHGAASGKFPFGFRAWWHDKKGTYPESAQVFATERGAAAGVKQEPTGFPAKRFLAPDRIGKDSEWIPLVAGKTAAGTELVGAAVIRYHGERTGAAVLCSLYPRGVSGTNNEENQARFTARAMAMAFAEGVEAYFPYNLRSFEVDPAYSEHHFGLMHADFTPKPAYSAYANFTRERPAGSVNRAGAWHDADRTFFFPQWTRPDGKKAGMVWCPDGKTSRELRFVGGEPVFHNLYGRKIAVRKVGNGLYLAEVGESPLYFLGAELDMARQ